MRIPPQGLDRGGDGDGADRAEVGAAAEDAAHLHDPATGGRVAQGPGHDAQGSRRAERPPGRLGTAGPQHPLARTRQEPVARHPARVQPGPGDVLLEGPRMRR
ncbi:hypothetical protein [Streptomyces sp. NPDC058964]|uniref:hypothetical protein n=1 Tax=Streptomyces sp. NPDC058964 TaxID=3346681 RepID=UPI003688B337